MLVYKNKHKFTYRWIFRMNDLYIVLLVNHNKYGFRNYHLF